MKPPATLDANRIITGDCRDVLRDLAQGGG